MTAIHSAAEARRTPMWRNAPLCPRTESWRGEAAPTAAAGAPATMVKMRGSLAGEGASRGTDDGRKVVCGQRLRDFPYTAEQRYRFVAPRREGRRLALVRRVARYLSGGRRPRRPPPARAAPRGPSRCC